MRARIWLSFVGASFALLGACGESQTEWPSGSAGQSSGGSAGSGAGQAGMATAGKSGGATAGNANAGTSAGGATGGGTATGGKPAAGESSGGKPSGGAATGGSGSGGEAGAASLVDCDPRKITCKRAAPACAALEAPSVEGSCYGECVKIERCACDSAEACPNPNEFTCWNNVKHCGPFVR